LESNDWLARSIFSGIYASFSVFQKNGACCTGTGAVPVRSSRERDRGSTRPLLGKRGRTIASKTESEEADGTSPSLDWRNGRTPDGLY